MHSLQCNKFPFQEGYWVEFSQRKMDFAHVRSTEFWGDLNRIMCTFIWLVKIIRIQIISEAGWFSWEDKPSMKIVPLTFSLWQTPTMTVIYLQCFQANHNCMEGMAALGEGFWRTQISQLDHLASSSYSKHNLNYLVRGLGEVKTRPILV